MTTEKLDVYIPVNASPAIREALSSTGRELSKELRLVGKGYALNYENTFGFATANAIDRLKEIEGIWVNERPPEIQAVVDAEELV
jgi:hypothetical protein